jgi:hypothetical protein
MVARCARCVRFVDALGLGREIEGRRSDGRLLREARRQRPDLGPSNARDGDAESQRSSVVHSDGLHELRALVHRALAAHRP